MVKVTALSSKEVPPGWLGKEETPSSWLPLSEAREGQPKEATATSCE